MKSRGGSQHKDTSGKTHYQRNRSAYIQRVKERKQQNVIFIQQYKREHGCIDCQETDFRVLDFDHVRGTKIRNVSSMALRGCSLDTIKTEISKCEVRCANCHRRKTFNAGMAERLMHLPSKQDTGVRLPLPAPIYE